MELFIDTKKIKDNEKLLNAILSNLSTSEKIKKEIKNLEKEPIEEIDELEYKKEIDTDDNIPKEDCIIDDLSYQYYYKNIRNAMITLSYEELAEIIRYNFPSKNNSNYFRLSNRIKSEIYKEIIELSDLLNDSVDNDFLEEIKKTIAFEKMKLSIINMIENQDNEIKENVENQKNKIVFHTTNLGNIYALDDIDSINNEYNDSILELIESIQNGTFKNVKFLTSTDSTVNGLAEVKGFKTRVIFDRIDKNTYVILHIFIKKSDNDRGYKESLRNRISTYRCSKSEIISRKDDENYLLENDKILEEIISRLSSKKKKVLVNE